jgi:hypothetical protein
VALASIGYVFEVFIEVAVTFLEGAIAFLGGAVMFMSKGSLAIGRLFKVVETSVADDIKGVIGRDLR